MYVYVCVSLSLTLNIDAIIVYLMFVKHIWIFLVLKQLLC